MQLKSKLSIFTSCLLISTTLNAEDFVRVNYLKYSENDDRIEVDAPSFELNKDFGVDYTLNVKLISDTVSGATPVYLNSTSSSTTSGASTVANSLKSNTNPNITRDNDDDDDDTTSGASKTSDDDDNENNSSTGLKKQNVAMEEERIYSSISLVTRLENRDEITTSIVTSRESDYDSDTLSMDYLLWANSSKNRSYNFGFAYQRDEVLIKNCSSSNYICSGVSDGSSIKKELKNFSTEIGLTQIIDKESLLKFSIFYGKEDGYLSNPHYNVVRNYNGTTADFIKERRPDTRRSYGFNTKYIRSYTSKLATNYRYRFYTDEWDITSHTIDTNNYYESDEKTTLGFGIRYYMQSEAKFFSDNVYNFTDQTYASHDDRLSDFNAITYKFSLDFKYDEKLSYNFGLNMYDQSTGLKATFTSIGMKYSF